MGPTGKHESPDSSQQESDNRRSACTHDRPSRHVAKRRRPPQGQNAKPPADLGLEGEPTAPVHLRSNRTGDFASGRSCHPGSARMGPTIKREALGPDPAISSNLDPPHQGRASARLPPSVSPRQWASVSPPGHRPPAALWGAPDYPNTNSRPEAPMRTPVAENSHLSGDATTC